jgi:MFS family permease
MASLPPTEERDSNQSIASVLTDVSDRAMALVREEVELAKAELAQRAAKLAKGAVVGVAAGVFLLTALVFALVGLALLLYFELPVNVYAYFWGFFAMAAILVLLGVIAGVLAAKVVKAGSPPVPKMAIEEARKIRDTVSAGPGQGQRVGAPPGRQAKEEA